MSLKKHLYNRIRGWLPKERSLPQTHQTRLIDQLIQLQLLRAVYGVMLGALLFAPFGVYHSTVEPYVAGYLWGYNLPIGYVGLLLGTAALLYPRLNAPRRLGFGTLMALSGVFLLLTFLFSPNAYFINLQHGTSFSAAQIDVDFQLGNLAVMGLAVLSIVFGLASAPPLRHRKRPNQVE